MLRAIRIQNIVSGTAINSISTATTLYLIITVVAINFFVIACLHRIVIHINGVIS